jgi:hypothetical protein
MYGVPSAAMPAPAPLIRLRLVGLKIAISSPPRVRVIGSRQETVTECYILNKYLTLNEYFVTKWKLVNSL